MDGIDWNESNKDQWLVLHNAIQWVKGAIFQGDRHIGISDTINSLNLSIIKTTNNPNAFFQVMHQIEPLREICKFEEELFVFAIDRAVFSLKEAAKFYSEFNNFVTVIENALGAGNVKDVRDMRTHIDKYSKGRGNAQDRFIYESPDDLFPSKPFADHLFAADATSTIIIDGQYLIGGRVNVQKSIEILKRLQPSIQETCDKYSIPPQPQ